MWPVPGSSRAPRPAGWKSLRAAYAPAFPPRTCRRRAWQTAVFPLEDGGEIGGQYGCRAGVGIFQVHTKDEADATARAILRRERSGQRHAQSFAIRSRATLALQVGIAPVHFLFYGALQRRAQHARPVCQTTCGACWRRWCDRGWIRTLVTSARNPAQGSEQRGCGCPAGRYSPRARFVQGNHSCTVYVRGGRFVRRFRGDCAVPDTLGTLCNL